MLRGWREAASAPKRISICSVSPGTEGKGLHMVGTVTVGTHGCSPAPPTPSRCARDAEPGSLPQPAMLLAHPSAQKPDHQHRRWFAPQLPLQPPSRDPRPSALPASLVRAPCPRSARQAAATCLVSRIPGEFPPATQPDPAQPAVRTHAAIELLIPRLRSCFSLSDFSIIGLVRIP